MGVKHCDNHTHTNTHTGPKSKSKSQIKILQIPLISFGVAKLATGRLDEGGKIKNENLYRSKHKRKQMKYMSSRRKSRSNEGCVWGGRGGTKERKR